MYSKNVIHAIDCFRNSESVLKNSNPGQPEWEFAYSEECRLFNEFFPKFSREEHARYVGLVQWLGRTGLSSSDLTTAKLIEIYQRVGAGLPIGEYMRKDDVISILLDRYSITLPATIEELCTTWDNDSKTEFYRTDDLKSLMPGATWKELQCEVVTHMITE